MIEIYCKNCDHFEKDRLTDQPCTECQVYSCFHHENADVKDKFVRWIKADNKKQEPDMVNRPQHYLQGGIETIECIKSLTTGMNGFEGYLAGCAVKYIGRCKHKGKPVEDSLKARWYINRLIKELENGNKQAY